MTTPDNLRNEDYATIKPQFINKLVIVGKNDNMGCVDPVSVFISLNLQGFGDKQATTNSIVNRLILEGYLVRCEGKDKDKIRLTEKGVAYEKANYKSQSELTEKRAAS